MWQLDLDFSQPLPTPSPEQKTVVSQTSQSNLFVPVKRNRDGSRKLEDFGEDLGNTRKGQKRTNKIESRDEICQRLASEPLEKVWPKDSILKMKNTQAASLLWLVRQQFPNRRPMKKFQLQRYIDKAAACIEFQMAIENDGLTTDRLLEISPKMLDLVYDVKEVAKFLEVTDKKYWPHLHKSSFRSALDICRWNRYELPDGADLLDGKMRILMSRYSIPREESFHGYKLLEGATWEELGRQINNHLEQQFANTNTQQTTVKPVSFMYRPTRDGKYQIIGKRGAVDLILEEVALGNRTDLFQYVRDNTKQLTQKYEEIREELSRDEYSYKTNLIRDRVGTDWRQGKDVTPEKFEEIFGFRGVEFGNWVNQGKNSRERQWMLNNAFDAFNDLAELLNLPPKAMALDGSLGLAFGSRGHGKASAHYEPSNKVINLTKTKGYSSLAHEWFHALDHYIASSNSSDLAAFQSNFGNPIYKLKPEAKEKIANGIEAEFTKNLFERIEAKVNNPYANFFKDNKTVKASICGTSEVTSHTKVFDIEVSQDDLETHFPDLLRTTIRPELYHAWYETIETIRSTRMSDRTKSRALKKGKAERSIEEDYWYSKIEQAARSFEGFVEAKLAKEGKISDFLTVGSYTNQTIKNGENNFFPYLDGDDVERVSEKFVKVFDVIKTRQTEKGVMLFSRLIDTVEGSSVADVRRTLIHHFGKSSIDTLEENGLLRISDSENMAYVEAMLNRAKREKMVKIVDHPVSLSKINRLTQYVVHDKAANRENLDGCLAIFHSDNQAFPSGLVAVKLGFHHPFRHRGFGAYHLTGNVLEQPSRNLFPQDKNKTEAALASCSQVLETCTSLFHEPTSKGDSYLFYSDKYKRGIKAEFKDGIYSVTTDRPVKGNPVNSYGDDCLRIKVGQLSMMDKQSPKQKLEALEKEIASGVLSAPELGASATLPPRKLQRATTKAETRPNWDMGTTSVDNYNDIYEELDLTREVWLDIQKAREERDLSYSLDLACKGNTEPFLSGEYIKTVLNQVGIVVKNEISRESLIDSQGFYDPLSNCSYLIASNLTQETIVPVLLHEVGVHMAYDSILHDKFIPVIDQATQIVNEGLTQNDPLSQAVKNRLDLVGISSEDENYKEEVCAHLVEEVAKQELAKPQFIQWFNNIKSTVNTWLVEHGWKDVDSLSATDIATIAKNNVRELSKLKVEQAFTLKPEISVKTDLMLSKSETLSNSYIEQKELLDQTLQGKFILPGYVIEDGANATTFETQELGENISIKEAIKEAKYLYENEELDNIAFIDKNGVTIQAIDETLARDVAKKLPFEPKLDGNKMLLNEYNEVANIMGQENAKEYLEPIIKEIMMADRHGVEYQTRSQETLQTRSALEKSRRI